MKIQSINPYTNEMNAEYDAHSEEQSKEKIQTARKAFQDWKTKSVTERIEFIKKIKTILEESEQEYAELITKEMGKPIKEARGEVKKCGMLCDYYAENAKEFLKDKEIKSSYQKSYVTYEPLGVILGVMPWNFPFWQVFRFMLPSMIVGNVCILKHASNVPGCAIALEDICKKAGIPEGVFTTLLIGAGTTMSLMDQDLFEGASLTGSLKAGSEVAMRAGRNIRKVVLELGGSDPFIVLEDADVEKAAKMAVASRYLNAGQSCIGAKRWIVHPQVADEFKAKVIENLKALKVGDPMSEDTDIGPLAKEEFVKDMQGQYEDAKNKGATIEYTENKEEKGFFFTPCIITNTNEEMNVHKEEVFGPMASMYVIEDEKEMIRIANATEFGLGAMIFSKNIERAEGLAKHIESGTVTINGMIKSNPALPFGGIKKSGVGRELAEEGMKEFVNIKTIAIE